MAVLAAQGVQFVAVFDADFKPDAAFLRKTVPYLMGNAQASEEPGCSRAWPPLPQALVRRLPRLRLRPC